MVVVEEFQEAMKENFFLKEEEKEVCVFYTWAMLSAVISTIESGVFRTHKGLKKASSMQK